MPDGMPNTIAMPIANGKTAAAISVWRRPSGARSIRSESAPIYGSATASKTRMTASDATPMTEPVEPDDLRVEEQDERVPRERLDQFGHRADRPGRTLGPAEPGTVRCRAAWFAVVSHLALPLEAAWRHLIGMKVLI